MENRYNKNYFDSSERETLDSAKEIVPHILKLANIRSVIDIGCGTGAWLKIFSEHGIADIYGVDGPWIKNNQLLIPEKGFLAWDLTNPLQLDRRFDLVVSLEVAEHLPEKSAEVYANSIAQLGDLILFSAAIPHQPGTNHINTQWPEYWIKIFLSKGFIAIDPLRKLFWDNDKVGYYYAQNMIILIKKSSLEAHPALYELIRENGNNVPSLVHPKLYLDYVERLSALQKKLNRIPAPLLKILKLLNRFIAQ